ncbi:MAG: hypothetical protein KJ879_02430, partial [Nanoarchaeota archaeon]|nr:hypothetical protein [Nanoarchaeota archaeon]
EEINIKMKHKILLGILILLVGVVVFAMNFLYVDSIFLLVLSIIVFFVGLGLTLNPENKEGFIAEVLNLFTSGSP